MESWINFWGVVLIATLVIFAGLAVVISIGGFSDLKALFRSMDEQHREQETEDDS